MTTDSIPSYSGPLKPSEWSEAKAACKLFCPVCTLRLQRRSRRISVMRRPTKKERQESGETERKKASQSQSYYWCERCRIGWQLPKIMKLTQLELPGMGK